MGIGTPQGTLNHWRREADKLPAPQWEGEWTVSPGGVRFEVVAGHGEDGKPMLAWEAAGSGEHFRVTIA